ncbi:hypothetical protein ACIXEH_11290 [Bacteroides fragilis]
MEDNEKIHYVGWLSSEKTIEYFFASDLAVFPGTHSVLWEQAVGIGIPSIFKYWDGMTHVDLGGNCLFLFENSSEEISKKNKFSFFKRDKVFRNEENSFLFRS